MGNEPLDLNNPLVSVIIPAYNAERFIKETLQSVISQTYKNLEILVVDDGSTDQTPEIVRSFLKIDSRIHLLQQKNAGVAAARNLAIQKSKGDYIAPLDADDIWFPSNIEKQVYCLKNAPEIVGLVYAWSVDIDESGAITGGFYNATIEGDVLTTLVCRYFPSNACASLIRRTCFEKVGGYNCRLKEQNAQGCEDWDIHLRIAQYYQFRVVPEFLIGYRQLSSSMSCDCHKMAKSYHLVMNDMQQRQPELSPILYNWSKSNFYMYLAWKSYGIGKYRDTLNWLKNAFNFDPVMTLVRHNFYMLTIQSLAKLIVAAKVPANQPSTPTNMNYVVARMNIHKFLPSQLYEAIRFKKLLQERSRQISLTEI